MATKYYEDTISKAGLTPVKAEDLQAKFDAITKAEYDKQRTDLQTAENKFYNQLYDTQRTTMDTIRQANADAVATGASRGVQAANELSALLGLQQESVEGATDIAKQATALAQDETQAMLENVLNAETQAQEANQALANILVQAGSVDVEQQNANTAAAQVQQQWQQLIEQIRQTNPDMAEQLQVSYNDYYKDPAEGLAYTPTNTPVTEEDKKILSGKTPLTFEGASYTLNSKHVLKNEETDVSKRLDGALRELGYAKGHKDPNIKDGTTVTIKASDYEAAIAGIPSKVNFWDVLGGIATVGQSNQIPEKYTLTYYKGNWYPSTKA